MHDDEITLLEPSLRSKGGFEFLGSRVAIVVEPRGNHWNWAYSIDGQQAGVSGLVSPSQRRAFEDASIAARDRIRTERDPAWRLVSQFGGV